MPIVFKNISYTYARKTPNEYLALNNANLTINEGEYVAIVGQTGSGKSTLVQLLNGLTLPTGGELFINDKTTKQICKRNKTTKELRKKIGVVFQFPEYQLFEETIVKDVAFGLINYGLKKEEAYKKAKEDILNLGLDESYFEKSPFEISGGERRKVAIAGILALDPDVFVLEEPTAGLDPKSKNDLLDFIEKLHQNGKTIIVVTHDMSLVLKYSNHVIMLDKGEVFFDGNTKDFFLDKKVEELIEIPDILKLTRKLIDKGVNIDISKIISTESLIDAISKWREQNG